ncbi:hypothetical protein LXT21_35785 [Myxococcus sp. K38C18041901]|uniref:hypothetical protein n=1 Tax=Myxococcus guangdongensis TaxID=2906760 RepID=UPI0020A78BA1|nr:hypothetical protein [Myxococcus guangdongensis]MCP3064148.1 hypothetical protein [Myxococcus guangdongensis]
MRLTEHLAGLNADDQGAFARRNAENASIEELFDALDLDPLGEWAMLHLTDALTRRGPGIIGRIEARLVERPTRHGAYALGETLIALLRDLPETGPAIVRVFIAAGEAALRTEASSRGARTFVIHLADCAMILERALPEARPLARAFIVRARDEPVPDTFSLGRASFLVGDEQGGDSGGPG